MRSLFRCNCRNLAMFAAIAGFSSWQNALAQVVYSVGTQEVYDSNIFLEDDKSRPNLPANADGDLIKQIDGNPDDDLISNPYISLAGRIPTGSKVVTNYSAKFGFILYNENSEQNRFALDGGITVAPGQDVLPQYTTLSFSDVMSSQASAVGVSQGAAAQQGQINVATLSGGLSRYQLDDADAFSNIFSIARQDYLDQFNLQSSNADRLQIPGVDSFTYAMNTRVDRTFNSQWGAFIANNLNYYDVTGGDFQGTGLSSGANSNLDRVNISPSVGGSYAASTRLQFTASTGVDFSEFTNNSDDSALPGVSRDSNQSSFFYGAGVSYVASERASVAANILQSAGTDVNGARILSRSAGVNGSYIFSDRFSGNLGAQFSQFSPGDELSQPTDRFTVTAAARYSITEAIAIAVGYNFNVQNADNVNAASVALFNNGDYQDNQVFISLDTGFVGFVK